MAEQRPQSPGLKWRPRKNGPNVPGWYASTAAIQAGYPVKFVNLSSQVHNPVLLVDRAERLQAQMLLWVSKREFPAAEFNGTFKWLLENYQKDPDSTFNTKLKPGTVRLYTTYLKKLIVHIGELRIDACNGRDVMRWFAAWRVSEDKPGRDLLSVARVCLAVLKATVDFGVVCRSKGCIEFDVILGKLEFETLPGRTQAPTAEQIVAVRKAAHAAGAPRRALAYAIQFETTLRQWDVIGQWLPLSDPKPSTVLHNGKKWIGPSWSAISDKMILAKVKPTKTEDTSEVEVSFDLAACPMVQEELAHIPVEQRTGPLIVKELHGRPYDHEDFRKLWRKDAEAAEPKLPKTIWNRDIRAGGITEAERAKTRRADRSLLAGHVNEDTTEGYERDQDSKVEDMLDAHRRVMAARVGSRGKKE